MARKIFLFLVALVDQGGMLRELAGGLCTLLIDYVTI